MSTILQRLQKIFDEDYPELKLHLKPTTSLKSIGFFPLDKSEIVLAIKDEFDIFFDHSENLKELQTVQDLINVIEKQIKE